MQPRTIDVLRDLERAESFIAAGSWEDAEQILGDLREDFEPGYPEIEIILQKTRSVLISARASREHLRSGLRSMVAGRQFQQASEPEGVKNLTECQIDGGFSLLPR